MAPKKTTKPVQPAKVAKAAQPKVDPTSLSTQQIYSGEQERKAAIAEVTRLRREFDTTTAAGAKAFAADPTAQAALARLDKAKSAVGMRTSAQDLQALNTVTGQGQTKALNAPSQQYFQSLYGRGEMKPIWEAPKGAFRNETKQEWLNKGYDLEDSYFTWSWDNNDNQWKVKALGSKYVGPLENYETAAPDRKPTIAQRYWEAGKVDLSGYLNRFYPNEGTGYAAIGIGQVQDLYEIADKLPNLTWKEFIATLYEAATTENAIVEPFEFLQAYDEIFGRNK